LSVAARLTDLDARFAPIASLVEESLIALREGVDAVERYQADLDADPNRQEWIEQRLAAIESIARKHRVEPAALPELQTSFGRELEQLETLEASLEKFERNLGEARTAFEQACAALSRARKSAGAALSQRITGLLQTLGMPGGVFRIDVQPVALEDAGPHGADDVEFLVSANPGQPPRSLAKIASGGELSRISLAIQVAAVQNGAAACLVFDEVDAGVGGGVAEIVGRQLRALGDRAQVLCVTHLPQVASQAHAHVRVAKLTDGKTTRTSLHTLTADERVEEIARMLGGVDITDKAREHAAEMLAPTGSSFKKKKQEPARRSRARE
jgi:DNA repair protein RecN (Recombination protein N)